MPRENHISGLLRTLGYGSKQHRSTDAEGDGEFKVYANGRLIHHPRGLTHAQDKKVVEAWKQFLRHNKKRKGG